MKIKSSPFALHESAVLTKIKQLGSNTAVAVPDCSKLYAQLRKDGKSLRFFLRYSINGKNGTKSYGNATHIEELLAEYTKDLELCRQKVDPKAPRTNAKQTANLLKEQQKEAKQTVQKAFDQWTIDICRSDWESKGYREQTRRFQQMHKHLIRHVANLPMRELTSQTILSLENLKELNIEHPSTAKKVIGYLKVFFGDYESKDSKFESPLSEAVLSKFERWRRTANNADNHFAAPHYSYIPYLMHVLFNEYGENQSADLFQMQILLGMRNKALINLRWKDIDFPPDWDGGYLVIPQENNKIKKQSEEERTVYFGGTVKHFLYEKWEQVTSEFGTFDNPNDFIFPKKRNKNKPLDLPKPLGENAINQFLQRTFHKQELEKGRLWIDPKSKELIQAHATARSCLQTWAAEQKDEDGRPKYSKRALDACLQHTPFNKTESAYNRSKVDIDEILRLKNEWEDYCLSYDFKDGESIDDEDRDRRLTSVPDLLIGTYMGCGGKQFLEKITAKVAKSNNKEHKDKYRKKQERIKSILRR